MVEKSKDPIIKINRSASKLDLVDIIVLFQSHSLHFVEEFLCLEQIFSTRGIFRETPFPQETFDLLESFRLLWVSLLICRR